MELPDRRGREAILGVHARSRPLSDEVSMELWARRTPGFSGADLANLINEAAILTPAVNARSSTSKPCTMRSSG